MVRAVLYCTVLYCAHLAMFMQYTGVFPTVAPIGCTPCKPDSQLKIDPTPTPPTPIMCVVKLRINSPLRKLLADLDHAFSPRQPAAPMIRVEFRNCTVHVEQGLGTCSGHPSGFAGIPRTLLIWAVVDARGYR